MKRFVIILLALLSGLSVPQAVAFAGGQGDASAIVAATPERGVKPALAVSAAVLRQAREPALPRQIEPAEPALPVPVATVHCGDRARE